VTMNEACTPRTSRWATVATLALLAPLALAACNASNNSAGPAGSGPAGSGPASSGPASSGPASSGPASSGPASSGPASAVTCPGGSLSAEGSTAQKNAFEQVMADYGSACSNKATINYNATGSGAGIKSFYNGQVDFAGSDSALKSVAVDGVVETEKAKARCGGNDAWNIPMAVGPVAFSYNIDGVDKLVLTAEVLSQIFTGSITTWNDPAIAKINSGATLPSAKITVFFRSDESGTTENVTKFLKAAGKGKWTKDPGKAWTGIGEGKNKTAGVADAIKATKNSISYVEWSYAQDNHLSMAQLDNGAGPVELTATSVGKAVSAAKVVGTSKDLKLTLDYATKTAGAYPAMLVTYEVVCSKGLAADKTALAKDFLKFFASDDEQKSLQDIGYAPLPTDLSAKVKATIDAIT